MGIHERFPHGATGAEVGEAHRTGARLQAPQGVRHVQHWIAEESGKVFCLVEGPSAEAVAAVHRIAYGIVADRIYRVHQADRSA